MLWCCGALALPLAAAAGVVCYVGVGVATILTDLEA